MKRLPKSAVLATVGTVLTEALRSVLYLLDPWTVDPSRRWWLGPYFAGVWLLFFVLIYSQEKPA